jgi:hypothetical protein
VFLQSRVTVRHADGHDLVTGSHAVAALRMALVRTHTLTDEQAHPFRDAVLDLIKAHPGISDRDLAATFFGQGTPGRRINGLCRELAEAGLTRRWVRPDLLLGNWSRQRAPH